MLREVRYFVEDLSATTIVVLGLVLGLLLGAFATYRLTDGTPYSQSDLDRAGAARPVEVPTPVVATTDPEDELKAQRLQARLRDTRTELAAAELKADKLRTRLTDATTSLDAMEKDVQKRAKQERRASRPTDTTVAGTLDVVWVLGKESKPWPASCTDVLSRYRVAVDDGSEEAGAVAEVSEASETGRTVDAKAESLTLSCRGTYSLSVTGTSDAVFGFSAVAGDAPDKPLATVLATASEVAGGEGPTLSVTL